MNTPCRKDVLEKTEVLNVLDQLRCEVQENQSQGFILLKVVSRGNNDFASTTMVVGVNDEEILDLIRTLLVQTDLAKIFIGDIIARFIGSDALKHIKLS